MNIFQLLYYEYIYFKNKTPIDSDKLKKYVGKKIKNISFKMESSMHYPHEFAMFCTLHFDKTKIIIIKFYVDKKKNYCHIFIR